MRTTRIELEGRAGHIAIQRERGSGEVGVAQFDHPNILKILDL